MVTAYDFESGPPGSNPEWGLICYMASIIKQGVPKPSSLWGITLGTRAAELELHGTGAIHGTGACKLIDGCSQGSVTPSVASAGIYDTEIISQLKIA